MYKMQENTGNIVKIPLVYLYPVYCNNNLPEKHSRRKRRSKRPPCYVNRLNLIKRRLMKNDIWRLLSKGTITIEKRNEIVDKYDIPESTLRYWIQQLQENSNCLPKQIPDRSIKLFAFTLA